jgi:hypothetical protein
MNQLPENRAQPRMAVDCGIEWRPVHTEESRTGFVRNISGNGVLFIADERPAIGDRMEITMCTGVLSIPAMSALVEVVRVEQGPPAAPDASAPGGPCYEIGARIMMMR